MSKKMGVVYFIKPTGLDGPIKIGYSRCAQDRIISLGIWSPWPLELIGTVKGTIKDEQFLHSCFANCHSHREWFHSTPGLRETISKILQLASVDAARADLTPVGAIRTRRLRSPEFKLRSSYIMRVHWALKRLERADPGHCYFLAPADVSAIMDRWQGSFGPGVPPQAPSDEDIAVVDRFLADPAAAATRRERHSLRAVA